MTTPVAFFASRARALLILAPLITLTPKANGSDSPYTACAGCHGPEGVSQTTHMPSTAGLNFRYFSAAIAGIPQGSPP